MQPECGTGRTGGRNATTGVIPGRVALSVGCPDLESPKGWDWTLLGSVAQLESGHTPSRKHMEYWNGGIPWIGIKDATENHGRTIFDTHQHVSELGLRNSSARLLPANTVCLSRTASVGFVVVMGRSMATSQDFVNWICGPNIEPHYLKYILLSETEALWRFASGTTHQTIYYPEAKAFHVLLPPLSEQRAIAAVLGALDDKIELNRRMNATLESIARALFQSWFVDFDPVRAKLDGRKPVGMDEETAALFPDSFKESPIGPIPVGWKVERLDSHISADRGLSYKGEGLSDDQTGMPMHNLNSIFEGGGYKHQGIKYYKGEYREKHLVEPGDMIVTNTEQGFDHLLIGHAAVVPSSFGLKGIYSHHIYRVRFMPSSPFNPHYLVELFNNPRWHYWISGFSNGTTINMLPIDALAMPLLVVPPKDLVMKFTAIARSAHDQIEYNLQQSRTLATLRDTLLPKLLSGELSVAGLHHEVPA